MAEFTDRSVPGQQLGMLPHDPAQIARLPQFRAHAVSRLAAPPVLDRSSVTFIPGLDGNDRIGDCTAVGLANAARAAVAINGYTLGIPPTAAPAFYSAASGYDPAKPETDQGMVEAEVFLYQARHGFDYGGPTPLVAGFATADPGDLNALRVMAWKCGSAYLGVNLAVADQGAVIWDTDTPASAGDPTPGSWGGHCLLAYSWSGTADTDIVRLATWGALQRATWRWVRSRLTETHALFWRQFGDVDGIDYEQLAGEVAAVSVG